MTYMDSFWKSGETALLFPTPMTKQETGSGKTDVQGETHYFYNEKNQLIKECGAERERQFTYDCQGGIMEEKNPSGIRLFSYNSRHQQTRVETENGDVQENRYDVENLRFELLENGNRTAFVYHNGELLHEEGGKEKQSSYHLGVGVDALQRGQETYYYHRDEQLSTTFITGTDGIVRNSYQYDAFGNLSDTMEQLPNRIRYTGQQYDALTGQYCLRARYYNPVLGRFMQEDAYQGDGLNLYAYCKNNPVVYYDPSGYNQNNLIDPNCVEAKIEEDEGNTTEDIYSFGNKSAPRGARPVQDFNVENFDSIVGPETGPLPKGASNVSDVNTTSLSGHYHMLPEGTQMPDGLSIIADGIDIVPNSPHGEGHYTIFPTRAMTVNDFNELYKSLPWQYGGKK